MTAVTCICSCVSKSFLLHLRTSKSMKDSWRYEFLNFYRVCTASVHSENSEAYISTSTADKWLRLLAFVHVCPRAFFCIFERRNRWRIREDMNFWIFLTRLHTTQRKLKIRNHISQQVLLINDCGYLHSFMCVQELSFASSNVGIDGGFVKIWIFEYF